MPEQHITEDRTSSDKGAQTREHWLEVRVFAPRDPEERTFVFDRTTTVGAAAEQVARDFGYAPGNHTFQTSTDDVLDRTVSLHAAHVHNNQLLELVDVGGGV
ncbi:hypothetical protein [Mycobacterium sp. SA01]|uniref:hypothetical protein n=1 Tax=Mycobacterium sp. SA01 TaxID=3238820 RepID=UPI00351AEA28